MFILNKKTGNVQECHNNDAIKVCKKDTNNYAVAGRREDLAWEHEEKTTSEPEKEPKKEMADNSASNDEKGAPEAAGAAVDMNEESLREMDFQALRKVAKEMGIQGYVNMNKETLIAMILNH